MSNIHTLLLLNYQLYFYIISPTKKIAIMMRYQNHTQQQPTNRTKISFQYKLSIKDPEYISQLSIYIIHYAVIITFKRAALKKSF